MSRRDTATRLIVARVVRDALQRADTALRASASADFDVPGVREVAVVGNEPIGHVQLNKGSQTWSVTDLPALLAWVEANRPGEVVTTRVVRSSFITAVLERAKADGAAVDRASGEAIPGIGVRNSPPTLSVKPGPDAAQVVAAAFAAGDLSFADVALPAIEAGAS